MFLKLDLGYVVAAGAIFTGLKLEIDDLLINFGIITAIPVIFSLLVIVDAVIYSTLYEKWAKLNQRPFERWQERVLGVLMCLQVPFHLFFFVGLLTALTAFGRGSFDQIKELEAKARIQRAINLVIARTDKVPTTTSALPQSEYFQAAIEKLGPENIRITATGGTSYTLTFAGKDRKFGTPDDDEYTDKLSAVEIFETLYGEKRHATGTSKTPP